MEFPAWATPGENRKLFEKGKANGADELILSDFDATTGFLEGKSGNADFDDFWLLMNHFLVLLDLHGVILF